MSEIKVEMNSLLVDEIDKFAAVLEQRDSARRWAVWLEQENAHLEQERDALILELEQMRDKWGIDSGGAEGAIASELADLAVAVQDRSLGRDA